MANFLAYAFFKIAFVKLLHNLNVKLTVAESKIQMPFWSSTWHDMSGRVDRVLPSLRYRKSDRTVVGLPPASFQPLSMSDEELERFCPKILESMIHL